MIDLHVHISLNSLTVKRESLITNLNQCGFDSAVLISVPPPSFFPWSSGFSFIERLNNLFEWCGKEFYPFFWIDPIADDATEQVDKAVAAGVSGFKVICDQFFPSDPRAMNTFKLIASHHKPLLFHSGILWDGKPSSKYNRPGEFECLLEIPELRFALAHISWPWYDEAIAVFGKFLNARKRNPTSSAEMFIDTTPGTPEYYRRDAITKLFTIYDVSENVLLGSDNEVPGYSLDWIDKWLKRDFEILREIGIEQKIIDNYTGNNALRFINGA